MDKILRLTEEANNAHKMINDFVSGRNLDILDLMFPNHDGKSDPEAVANVMLLRDSLYNLCQACEMAVNQLTEDLEISDK